MSINKKMLLVLVAILMTGCSEVRSLFQAGDASITLDVEAVGSSNNLVLLGNTNLPVGTRLTFDIPGSGWQGVDAEPTYVAANGTFRSDVFVLTEAEAARNGLHTARVSVNVKEQRQRVREAMGNNGEHLKGPLVQWNENGEVLLTQEKLFSYEDGKLSH